MIKDFTPRLYQETIFATCAAKNTLVVLPTGMGKTNVFLMMAAHRMRQYPNSKILLIGPTKPLIDQYFQVFRKHFELSEEEMCILTGMVAPEKRAGLWRKSRIIFSTPQGLENDLITKRVGLEEVSLLGVDEAHRATGNYSYVWIAEQYNKSALHPRIIGMTASPGSDMQTINEVCKNLHIEEIEARTYSDADVKQYVQDIEIEWREVKLPEELLEIKRRLDICVNERIEKLKKWNLSRHISGKKDLLEIQAEIHGRIAKGEKDFFLWTAISMLAETIKVYHAAELLETQGISSLQKYFGRLMGEPTSKKSKAVKNLENDVDFRAAIQKTKALYEAGVEHPKLAALTKLVTDEISAKSDTKLIIFTQYRDSGVKIISELNRIQGVTAKLFVGQAKKMDTGMSQKKQKAMLDDFRAGGFNALCATSIGEEGLDIPKVDLVVFYEPIPSAIRHIQRRGRTGRQEKGRVIVLLTKGTRDETFRWVAHHKEKRMNYSIKRLKGKLAADKQEETKMEMQEQGKNQTIDKFAKKPTIYADTREQGSSTLKTIAEKAEIVLQRLETADYVCSSRVGIETKNSEDFVNSIIDGRLLSQMKDLRKNFERPVVIIEETKDLYSVRNVSANAIRGMLATIAVSYGIPVLHTKSSMETAEMILAIAKKEQEEGQNSYSPHKNKQAATLKEMQEYVVSSFPLIGPKLAKPLLKQFRTIKNIVNAPEDELKKVELIGEKKAKEIRNVMDAEYRDD